MTTNDLAYEITILNDRINATQSFIALIVFALVCVGVYAVAVGKAQE